MSRKQLVNRKAVRCGTHTPSPYLVGHFGQLMHDVESTDFIVDVGCGNGRNSKYLEEKGFEHIMPLDAVADFGVCIALGKDKLPVIDSSVKVILANYILMFLNQKERTQLRREFLRIAAPGCRLMVELYPAKEGCFSSGTELEKMKNELMTYLHRKGWRVLHNINLKFIMENANG